MSILRKQYGERADRPLDEFMGGINELRSNPDTAIVVGCFVAQLLVRGFLTVLLVSVSFDLVHLGSSGVGWLAAMHGRRRHCGRFLRGRAHRPAGALAVRWPWRSPCGDRPSP